MHNPPVPGRRAFHIFAAAQSLPQRDRGEYLNRQCDGDSELRRQLAVLQRHDRTTDSVPLQRPALGSGFHVRSAAHRAVRSIHELPVHAGPFTLLAEIGAGSMGIVYRAIERATQRVVALKLLWRDLGSERERLRFSLEAQTLGKLRHFGIAHLYYSGTLAIGDIEQPYLAMELVEGLPLRQWISTFSPSVVARLQIIIDVCSAIESAHERGVIHRDLKPENLIMDSADGCPRPRILDFGIAKLLDRVPPDESREPTSLVGTPAYMSPEQSTETADIDRRSDVFSLGVIAYELLADELPFGHKSLSDARLHQALRSRFALRGRRARELVAVVGKAMALRPEERYFSARGYAGDLTAWLSTRPVSAIGSNLTYKARCFIARSRNLIAASALLAMLSMLLAFSALANQQRDQASTQERLRAATVLLDSSVSPLSLKAGTVAERTAILAMLRQWTTDVAMVSMADEAEVLLREDRVLRHLGDIEIDAGRWQEAEAFRRQSEAICHRLVELRPRDSLAVAEWATAIVRIGDAVLAIGDREGAGICYATSHALFQKLASLYPEEGRHVDDLAWSHERLAVAALSVCDLALCRFHLDCRERLMIPLERLRPGSITNLAGWRTQFSVRSYLAMEEGNHPLAISAMAASLGAARERLRRDVNSPPAIVEFAGSVHAHLRLGIGQLDREQGSALRREAVHLVERLLAQDPEHREAGRVDRGLALLAVHFP